MKLIKIDPFEKKVSLIDTDTMPELKGYGTLAITQKLVTRGEGGLVELLLREPMLLKDDLGTDLIGDEEALLKEERAFFAWETTIMSRFVFCGVALIIGVHEESGTWLGLERVAGVENMLANAIKRVQFLTEPQALEINQWEGGVVHG